MILFQRIYSNDKDKVVKDEQLKILDENLIKNYWQRINENKIFASTIEFIRTCSYNKIIINSLFIRHPKLQ